MINAKSLVVHLYMHMYRTRRRLQSSNNTHKTVSAASVMRVLPRSFGQRCDASETDTLIKTLPGVLQYLIIQSKIEDNSLQLPPLDLPLTRADCEREMSRRQTNDVWAGHKILHSFHLLHRVDSGGELYWLSRIWISADQEVHCKDA